MLMQIQGREIEEKHGKLNLWNGDSSRLHVRKAQYKYISNLFVWHLADIAHAAMGGTGVSSQVVSRTPSLKISTL